MVDGESMEMSQGRASQFRATQGMNPNVRRLCRRGPYTAAAPPAIVHGRACLLHHLWYVHCVSMAGAQVSVRFLRAVEGTVLLHINAAAKHDPLLFKELVRLLAGFVGCTRGLAVREVCPRAALPG